MALTALARNWLMCLPAFVVYASVLPISLFYGLPFLIFVCVLFRLAFQFSIPVDEDMDFLTANTYHKKGVAIAADDFAVSCSQNVIVHFDSTHKDWLKLQKLVVGVCFKFRRFSCIGKLNSPSDPRWTTKWVPVTVDETVVNRMIKRHSVENGIEMHLKIDELCNIHLPSDLPQWSFDYIENTGNQTCVWLWRVSHGVADGLRLIPVGSEFFTFANGDPTTVPSIGKLRIPTKIRKKTKSSDSDSDSDSKQTKDKKNKKISIFNRYPFFHPRILYQIVKDLYSVFRVIHGRIDTISPFKPDAKLHGPRYQFTVRNRKRMLLRDVKQIKNKCNVSVNDVMTALFAGGVREYILAEDPQYFSALKHKHFTCNAIMAFGFPPKERYIGQTDWLRNGFSFVEWPLYPEIADFYKRLTLIHSNATALRNSISAIIAQKFASLLCRLGFDSMSDANGAKAFAKHSCTFSNLPSWNQPIFYEQSKVLKLEATYFNYIPQVIFNSYNGEFFCTMCVDPNAFDVNRIQIIFDFMAEEIERLVRNA